MSANRLFYKEFNLIFLNIFSNCGVKMKPMAAKKKKKAKKKVKKKAKKKKAKKKKR